MSLNHLSAKWRQWRWQMEFYHTPLELRYSYRLLSRISDHPLLSLLLLFLRIPRFFPCRLPPRPRDIMAYQPEAYMNQHHPDVYETRLIPAWRWRDTPQRAFYRLYETVCAYDEPLTGYEAEYLWRRSDRPAWRPEMLRDPREDGCADREQLAVMASLADALTDAFNWRLELGLRPDGELVEGGPGSGFVAYARPAWTAAAPRLQSRLVLHDYGDSSIAGSSEPFDRRNIQASAAALRTI
ncbi:hypothetical protein V2G26_003984 [Clonostachys chloroleuca]